MERKQIHARTKSEEALLNKQLASITDTMVRVARQRDEEVRKRELKAQENISKDVKGKNRVQAGPSDLHSAAPLLPIGSSRTTATPNNHHPSRENKDKDTHALNLQRAALLAPHPSSTSALLPTPTHPSPSHRAPDSSATAHASAQARLDALIATTLADEASYRAQRAARTVVVRRLAASATEADLRRALGRWDREVVEDGAGGDVDAGEYRRRR
ncbi:hypothetical protein G6514_003692 [Epicoccum nigrum]|nr:hypothetical protein G6514_003692 [Epicoccum nigrum]